MLQCLHRHQPRLSAIAETSDGRFWSGGADVIVTLAACLEESP